MTIKRLASEQQRHRNRSTRLCMKSAMMMNEIDENSGAVQTKGAKNRTVCSKMSSGTARGGTWNGE